MKEGPKNRHARWSSADDEQLRLMVHRGYASETIAEKLERTESAVYNRRRVLGLPLGESPYQWGSKRRVRRPRKYEQRVRFSLLWGLFTWYA